jgi:hypothetical protein
MRPALYWVIRTVDGYYISQDGWASAHTRNRLFAYRFETIEDAREVANLDGSFTYRIVRVVRKETAK